MSGGWKGQTFGKEKLILRWLRREEERWPRKNSGSLGWLIREEARVPAPLRGSSLDRTETLQNSSDPVGEAYFDKKNKKIRVKANFSKEN